MRTDRAVQSIVELIVRCLDPESITLFGSTAQNRARPDSDIDLLVVAHFREPRRLRGLELKGLLRDMTMRVDLHLRTPAELEAESRRRYSLADTVIRHGIRLYGRTSQDKARKRKRPPAH